MGHAKFRLRLLGGALIEGPEGVLAGPIAQRRRLALLALLAVARDRGLSRDKTIGYLWSESPGPRARHLLSESVYVIRKALGEEAILAAGDDLRLDPQVFSTDVADFEAALARGDSEAALAVYAGPFLDGFFLQGAPEFERWVERERRRLQQQAIEAASLQTRHYEALGALDKAVDSARQAVALSEGDEAAVRLLIGLLARSGNPAGAIRIYKDFAREMHQEYEVAPSVETRRLVEWIREWGGKGQPVLPEMQAGPQERPFVTEFLSPLSDLCIAVFPFSVHGSAELDYLGQDLAELLSVALDGAGGLRSIDMQALLTAQREAPDYGSASELARRLGARLCVLGRVLAEGESALALVSLYDLALGGTEVLKLTADRPLERIRELMDELAIGIVGAISQGPATRMTRVAATSTSSLPALRAWLAGERSYRSGSLLDAIEAFHLAVQKDSGFAPAYYRLAFILDSFPGRDHERSAGAIRAALLNADRLFDRDRDLFEAFSARLDGRANEAERIYARLVDLYPDDVDGWFGLAYVLAFYNPLRGRPFDESLRAFERVLILDPSFVPGRVALAYVTARRGDLKALDFLSELPLVSDTGLQMRMSRAFIRKDMPAQERWLAALSRSSDEALAEAIRYVVVLAHDLSGAKRVAALLTEATRSVPARAMGHSLTAHLDVGLGRLEAAKHELDRLGAFDPTAAVEYRAFFTVLPHIEVGRQELVANLHAVELVDPVAVLEHPGECLAIAIHDGLHEILRQYLLGLLRARMRDESEALRHAGRLASLGDTPKARDLAGDFACSVQAWNHWWGGRHEKVLYAAELARFEAWNEPLLYSPFHSRVLDRFLRGKLHEEAGRFPEAEGWYLSIEEYAAHDSVLLAPALLGLGRVHMRQGKVREAVRAFTRVIEQLRDCDEPFQPLVHEACDLRTRLALRE